jgi:hypothetical protein
MIFEAFSMLFFLLSVKNYITKEVLSERGDKGKRWGEIEIGLVYNFLKTSKDANDAVLEAPDASFMTWRQTFLTIK